MPADPAIAAALRAADLALRDATVTNFRNLMTVAQADRPPRNNPAAAAIAAFLRALPDQALHIGGAYTLGVPAKAFQALAAAVEEAARDA